MARFSKNGTAHARKRRVDKTPVKFKDLPVEKQRRQIILVALAVILIIAIIVIVKTELFSYLGGRIRFSDGALEGVQANDFVINRAKTGNYGEDGKYYVIGSLDIPEGFKENPGVVSDNDAYRQNFSYIVKEIEGYSEQVVFMGCTQDWENLIGNITSSNGVERSETYHLVSEVKGNEYHGAIQKHNVRNQENGYYYMYVYAYVETGVDDACVMIQNTYKTAYKKDLPSYEEALANLGKYVDMVNAVK